MATAPTRTRTRTRTRLSNVEPSEDLTKVKVTLEDDGNDALVTEQIGSKTVQYNAKVKEATTDEIEDDIETEDIENDFSGNTQTDYKENPKSGLDRAFDDITYFVTVENVPDIFYAKVARLPDSIGNNWNVPARDRFELGVLTFTHKDRFAFIPELQKINGNSGGLLAVDVYDSDHRPLMIQRARHHLPSQICFQVTVQNPPPMPIENSNGQPTGVERLLQEMRDERKENMRMIENMLNRSREKSALEAAIEQKVMNDILNPPQNNQTNGFEQAMTNMMMLPVFAQKLSERMFPEPPAPTEPTAFDRVMQIIETPLAQNMMNKTMDVINNVAENRMLIAQQKAGVPIETEDDFTYQDQFENNNPQPQPQTQQQTQPMQELITTIVSELESDNPLNASNETIQYLQAEFPTQVNMIKMACKGGTFTDVFTMLMDQSASIQPFPFAPYIDVDKSREQQKFILNTDGEKIKERLLEFYNYVRTT